MAYIIHNLTKRTIVLSDLRAEIGPHKMLDLEKVADRGRIERSYDLRTALNTSRLRLCSQGVVSKTSKPEVQIVEKVIEKHHHHEQQTLDEARLIVLIQQALKGQNKPQPQIDSSQQILDAMADLQRKIEVIGGDSVKNLDLPSVDPAKLAELQAKAIDKMSENIETGNTKTGKKVILKNTRLDDLASELD